MNPLRFAFVLVAEAAVTGPARLAAEEFDGAALYEKCVKSCVFLVSPRKEGRAEGTGTLIDAAKRLVVTCAHLLDRSETVYAQFPVRRGKAADSRKVKSALGNVIDAVNEVSSIKVAA